VAGENCDAVIETNRGISMGRVIWEGPAEKNTQLPEAVAERRSERVLRAPVDGFVVAHAEIGDHLEPGKSLPMSAGNRSRQSSKGFCAA